MTELPKELKRCPLIETVFEVRFTSSLPDEAVFGVIYQALLPQFPQFQTVSLPILQIPPEVRKRDPKLNFQTHYHLISDNLVIGIGPKSIGFSNRAPYKGWQAFKEFILSALDEIVKTKAIDTVQRSSIRYINIIHTPLFSATRLCISLGTENLASSAVTTFHTEIPQENGLLVVLQLNNNVGVSINGQQNQIASVIDIDALCVEPKDKSSFQKGMSEGLDKLHILEKQTFFGLLTEDFLSSLEPVYDKKQDF